MRNIWVGLAVILSVSACSVDNYDTGTGKYSLMRAEFVDAHVNNNSMVDYVITDDNDSLPASTPFSTKSIKGTNTFYRALFYYNKVADRTDSVAEPLSFNLVGIAVPVPSVIIPKDSVYSDPIYFQSGWIAKNRKYLNISLNKLTGEVDGIENVQYFRIIEDSVRTSASGSKSVYLRLSHNQNSVPEYYTGHVYISVSLTYYKKILSDGDSIFLRINTYGDGWIEKNYRY
jgi:hypothetical protein